MKSERAHASAESKRQLHALALDGSVTLHIGVVADAHRLLPAFFQLRLERKAYPSGMQVSRRPGGSALDDAGKADRDAIEAGQQLAQLVESGQHRFGRGHCRGHDPLPLANRLAGGVQQHGLQLRAANVDGQRDRAG